MIFQNSPLEEKLRGANGGKVALEIVADAAKSKKENIKKANPLFDTEKLSQLKEKNGEDYKKLRTLLDSKEGSDAKIKALQAYSIAPKEFASKEDETSFINQVKEYIWADVVQHTVQSMHDDTEKLALFESYWRGDIKSPEELNTKIEKRDQEIKKREELKQWEKTGIGSATFIDFQSFSTNFSKMPDGQIITYKSWDNDVYIKKDWRNEISLFASGVPIRGIKITDEKNPKTDIDKAMDSVQFIKNCGLSIFGNSLPKMIEIINNKQRWKGERKINLADGLDAWGEEERILLQYIAKILDIDAAFSIENLRKQFNEISNNAGLLPRLQRKPWYVTNNSLNMTTILGDLEKVGI